MQLFVTIGILYSNLFGWIFPITLFCILCAAVPVAFGLLFMFQPETPTYLIKHGQKDKAIAAFARLRGKDYDPSGEIAEIEKQAAKEEELKDQFTVQLRSVQGKKSSTICFMLMFYQQLSGINAVMFYSGDIFKDAGSTIQPELCATIIGVVQVIATLFSSWSIDKLGRKVLLMISAGLMAISTLMMTAFFFIKDLEYMAKDEITKIGFLPLLALMLFIVAFSVGLGPIPWLASSEIFPPAIMARMSSYAGMFNWFLATCVTLGFGPANKLVGAYTSFFVFTVVSASAVFFVLIVIPETKGKTFQEIQDELGGAQ